MDIDGVTFGAPACSPAWVQKPLIKINMGLSFLPSLWPSAFSFEDPRMGQSTKEIIWKQCQVQMSLQVCCPSGTPRCSVHLLWSQLSTRSLRHRTSSSWHFFPEPIILQEQAWFISGPQKQASHSCLLRSLKTSLPGKQKCRSSTHFCSRMKHTGWKKQILYETRAFQIKRVFMRDTSRERYLGAGRVSNNAPHFCSRQKWGWV